MAARHYLKHNYFYIKEMKHLDINSIQYKRMFRARKADFAPLVEKYTISIFVCKVLLTFAAASVVLCFIIGGNNVIPERIAAFMVFFAIMIISGLLALSLALWANYFVTRYLEHLIEKFDVGLRRLSIERMHELIAAMQYDHDRIEKDEVCGCIYCVKTFLCDRVVEEYEDAMCPTCNKASVIHEKSGFPLSDEFLRQMHEYWIDD